MLEIIKIIFDPNVIMPIMLFGIPISAIVGNYAYKIKKLKLQNSNLSQEEVLLLKKTVAENQELRKRIENLESIIISLDKDMWEWKKIEHDPSLQTKQIEEIVNEIKSN